jgi:mercuric ion transport protein
MRSKTLIKLGALGSVVAGICCFTPIATILLSVIGLSAVNAYLDFILLPLLVFCIGIFIAGIFILKSHDRT